MVVWRRYEVVTGSSLGQPLTAAQREAASGWRLVSTLQWRQPARQLLTWQPCSKAGQERITGQRGSIGDADQITAPRTD